MDGEAPQRALTLQIGDHLGGPHISWPKKNIEISWEIKWVIRTSWGRKTERWPFEGSHDTQKCVLA